MQLAEGCAPHPEPLVVEVADLDLRAVQRAERDGMECTPFRLYGLHYVSRKGTVGPRDVDSFAG
jgi:hypothetical protein